MQSKHRILIMVGLGLTACLLALSAEINAHIFSVIVNNKSIAHAPIWLTCLLTIILAVLPLLWFSKLSPLHSLFSIFVYIIAVVCLVLAIAYFYKI